MIEININPVVLTVDSLGIEWDLIVGVLAAMLALLLFVTEASNFRLQKVHIFALCVLIPLSGFIGARLFFIIENLLFYHDTGPIIGPGLRAYGLFIGAVVAGPIYARITRIPLWQLSDIGIPCLILFMAVYRVGCVLVGCCYGLPCDLPWAVMYINPSSAAPLRMPIHPTQLYHLVWTMLVFVVVWMLRKRFSTAGLLTLVALILYSVGDFAIRLFRGNEPSLLGLALSQVTGLIIVVVAVSLLILRLKTAVR